MDEAQAGQCGPGSLLSWRLSLAARAEERIAIGVS